MALSLALAVVAAGGRLVRAGAVAGRLVWWAAPLLLIVAGVAAWSLPAAAITAGVLLAAERSLPDKH